MLSLALDPNQPPSLAYDLLVLYYSTRELTKSSDAIDAMAPPYSYEPLPTIRRADHEATDNGSIEEIRILTVVLGIFDDLLC
jgi:hypothetical protein